MVASISPAKVEDVAAAPHSTWWSAAETDATVQQSMLPPPASVPQRVSPRAELHEAEVHPNHFEPTASQCAPTQRFEAAAPKDVPAEPLFSQGGTASEHPVRPPLTNSRLAEARHAKAGAVSVQDAQASTSAGASVSVSAATARPGCSKSHSKQAIAAAPGSHKERSVDASVATQQTPRETGGLDSPAKKRRRQSGRVDGVSPARLWQPALVPADTLQENVQRGAERAQSATLQAFGEAEIGVEYWQDLAAHLAISTRAAKAVSRISELLVASNKTATVRCKV